jgi:hypothetical protein
VGFGVGASKGRWHGARLPSSPYLRVPLYGDSDRLEGQVALRMSPELRRRLRELARWHDAWVQRYGIDDAEWVPEGSEVNRRSPTPEQEAEFHRVAKKIMSGEVRTYEEAERA